MVREKSGNFFLLFDNNPDYISSIAMMFEATYNDFLIPFEDILFVLAFEQTQF